MSGEPSERGPIVTELGLIIAVETSISVAFSLSFVSPRILDNGGKQREGSDVWACRERGEIAVFARNAKFGSYLPIFSVEIIGGLTERLWVPGVRCPSMPDVTKAGEEML